MKIAYIRCKISHMKQNSTSNDLKVFISSRQSRCDECKDEFGSGAWIVLAGDKGALCLTCADIDHLIFLPSGDAALTRRSKKYSTLSAVVLKWSKARKRYESQGLLVEEDALRQAEVECLKDEDARAKRRQRQRQRSAEMDIAYVKSFSEKIREFYPKCPGKTAVLIAEHACAKYSGRVGRSAAAKNIDEYAIELAVRAHVRHIETSYDKLLMKDWGRNAARQMVEDKVRAVLAKWRGVSDY